MMVLYPNVSPENVESPKPQGSDTSSLVPDSFTIFKQSDQDCVPIKWEHVVSSDDVDEDDFLKTTKLASKSNP